MDEEFNDYAMEQFWNIGVDPDAYSDENNDDNFNMYVDPNDIYTPPDEDVDYDDDGDDEGEEEQNDDFDADDLEDMADGMENMAGAVDQFGRGIGKFSNAKGIGKVGSALQVAGAVGAGVDVAKRAVNTAANMIKDPFGSLRKYFADKNNPPNIEIFKRLWSILLRFPPTIKHCVKCNVMLGNFIHGYIDPQVFFIPTASVYVRWVFSGETKTYRDYVGTALAIANWVLELFFKSPPGKFIWGVFCAVVNKVLPKGNGKANS
jgi:hypothetical protein